MAADYNTITCTKLLYDIQLLSKHDSICPDDDCERSDVCSSPIAATDNL